MAIETGAQRVAATLRWLHRRRFMSPQQLQRFASVVGCRMDPYSARVALGSGLRHAAL